MVQGGPSWPQVVQGGPRGSKVAPGGPMWSNVVQGGPRWSNVVHGGPSGPKICVNDMRQCLLQYNIKKENNVKIYFFFVVNCQR